MKVNESKHGSNLGQKNLNLPWAWHSSAPACLFLLFFFSVIQVSQINENKVVPNTQNTSNKSQAVIERRVQIIIPFGSINMTMVQIQINLIWFIRILNKCRNIAHKAGENFLIKGKQKCPTISGCGGDMHWCTCWWYLISMRVITRPILPSPSSYKIYTCLRPQNTVRKRHSWTNNSGRVGSS